VNDLRIAVIGTADGWSTQRLLDAVEAQTGYRRLIEMQDVALELGAEHPGRLLHRPAGGGAGFDLAELDAVIVKKIAGDYSPDALDRIEMLRMLEGLGVRVFSRPEAMFSLIDRLSCTVKLRLGGIPMPATVVTESVEQALASVREFGAVVAKPLYTSKARGMMVLDARSTPEAELRSQLERFAQDNRVMYLQQLIEHPGRDLGVVFLGGEYLATYARVSGGSWSTSTSAGGKYQAHQPSAEIIELARRAQALFQLDFTCVDVVETPAGPKVFEVSAFGGFRGLLEACSVDAAARYVEHAVACLLAQREPNGRSFVRRAPAVRHA
jgi:tetrahydromethanopterin:alpha-L-glutamate ligase